MDVFTIKARGIDVHHLEVDVKFKYILEYKHPLVAFSSHRKVSQNGDEERVMLCRSSRIARIYTFMARQPIPSRMYSERLPHDQPHPNGHESRSRRNYHIQPAVYEQRKRRNDWDCLPSYHEHEGQEWRRNHSVNNPRESTRHKHDNRASLEEYTRSFRRETYASTSRPAQNYDYSVDDREGKYHPRSHRRDTDSVAEDNSTIHRRETSSDHRNSRKELFPEYVPYNDSYRRGEYERRNYRPMAMLEEANNNNYHRQQSSLARHLVTEAKPPRKNKREETLRSQPRKGYHLGTFAPPNNYPTSKEPPGPLPLLVLDLNGTLVCRDVGNSAKNNKNPVLRPYLKSFLQYCLAVPDSSASPEEHQDAWDEWKSTRPMSSKQASHGAHFWQSSTQPKAKQGATYRLLLWSSAQPHNVDSMTRAILSPEQAEQLLRIYARDTLVTKRLYAQKAPSIKDLKILWAVLNSDDIGKESEARLFAEARNHQDEQDPDLGGKRSRSHRGGASERAAEEAQHGVILPKLSDDGEYKEGKGYGQHNTLLLDDSVDKAKLQPFNHLLLPEFDRSRAHKTVAARDVSDREERERQNRNYDKDMDLDNVLLQVIGVLEHARYQVNVSCWIRFGGLGNFGGMGQHHPYYLDEETNISKGMDGKIIEEAFKYFSKPFSDIADANLEPRLYTPVEDRSIDFWVQEGKRALMRHDIPLQRF